MIRIIDTAGWKTGRLVLAPFLAGAFLVGCMNNSESPGDGSGGHDHHQVDISSIPKFPTAGPDGELMRADLPAPVTGEQALLLEEKDPPTFDTKLMPSGTGLLKTSAADCTIGFHNQTAILILPDQAKFTFASDPWYIEPCGTGWVRVMENPSSRYGAAWGSDYGHYHLGYQRGAFCITPGSQPGIMSGSTCVAIADPTLENRVLGSHSPDHWIRLYVYEQGPRDMTFSLKGIRVKEGAAIQIWIRQVDGDWRVWRKLGPNKWGLPGATGIREVLISGAAGATSPFFIDNIVVSVP